MFFLENNWYSVCIELACFPCSSTSQSNLTDPQVFYFTIIGNEIAMKNIVLHYFIKPQMMQDAYASVENKN